MSTNSEAFWAALPLLEEISQERTLEEAEREAEQWKNSPDLNEEILANWALEAIRILSLLKCSTCGQPIRRVRPDEGYDSVDWTHAEGGPVCDGPPMAYP